MIALDASGAAVGRLAAFIAKRLLEHEQVVVVNAEKAVFTGSTDFVVGKYAARRQMTDKADPAHSAKWPRRPDLFLRRVIRGMLPHRATRQKQALSRLRVYMGVPEGVQAQQFATTQKPSSSLVSVEEICRRLGWAT